jgi:hypothetical protein
VGSSWVLYLGFNWATCVYSLVYLEAHVASFFFLFFFNLYIYNITYKKKKKGSKVNAICFLHLFFF